MSEHLDPEEEKYLHANAVLTILIVIALAVGYSFVPAKHLPLTKQIETLSEDVAPEKNQTDFNPHSKPANESSENVIELGLGIGILKTVTGSLQDGESSGPDNNPSQEPEQTLPENQTEIPQPEQNQTIPPENETQPQYEQNQTPENQTSPELNQTIPENQPNQTIPENQTNPENQTQMPQPEQNQTPENQTPENQTIPENQTNQTV